MNYFVRRQEDDYSRCDGMLHEIKARDSLYKVSRLYGIPLEDLMEKHTGKRRTLQCSLEGSAKNENRIDTEKIARTAGQKLGLNIEIE